MSGQKTKLGLSRRGFLASMGVGAVGACVSGALLTPTLAAAADAPGPDVVEAGGSCPVALRVNGLTYRVSVEPRWTLLYVLRELLGLTGAKEGCGRGECGACTVLIDGLPRYACMTLAVEAEGARIETVEGLLKGEELSPLQQAFAQADAFQCGYCTPGQVMAAEGLLRAIPNPSHDQIIAGMCGNLCRCGAYEHIAEAVEIAAGKPRG